MEYDEEDSGAAGSIPEFGAIFMSNLLTRQECLRRQTFALPASQAGFVKNVKVGMVLFLFEFERRQLYGVYQAASDGAMNIVPHGFKYSRKHFPAQVSFTTIWSCEPLSEKEFRDAIKENYFSHKKFNFGLSEVQVQRLLNLFNLKKLKSKLPPQLPTEAIAGAAVKDTVLLDDYRLALSQRTCMGPNEYDERKPAILCDYQGNSLVRAEEGELLIEDGVNCEGKRLFDYRGDLLVKRRKTDEDDRLMMNDLANDRICDDHDILRLSCLDPPNYSLDEARRMTGDHRQLSVERVCNENQMDRYLHTARSSEYPMDHLGIWKTLDDRTVQRERFLSEIEPYTNSKNAIAFEHSDNLLREIRKTTAVGRFVNNEGMEFFGGSSVGGISRPLHCDHRIIHDGKFPVGGRVSGSMLDTFRGSSALNKNSEYIASVDRRVSDNGRLRKSERVETVADIHGFVNPVTSTEYPYYSKPKLNSSSFFYNSLPETSRSQLAVPHSFESSHLKFSDATITRAIPYIAELPNFSYGRSTSLETNHDPNLARDIHAHRGVPTDFYSLSNNRSSPYPLESEIASRYLDDIPELPAKSLSQQSSLHYETTSSFLNSKPSVHTDLNTSAPLNHRVSVFSKLSSTPVPSSNCENIEFNEQRLLAKSTEFSEKHSAPDVGLPISQEFMTEHVRRQEMDILASENFIRSGGRNYSGGAYHAESGLATYESQHFRFSGNMNLKEQQEVSEVPPFNSNVNRRSVFSRLTSSKEVRINEERNKVQSNHHDCFMDASADEVMKMLQKGNNSPLSKINHSTWRKSQSVIVGHPRKSDLEAKSVQSDMEINHSTGDRKRLKDDRTIAVGKPKHGKSDLNEEPIRSHMEINHSMVEKKSLKGDLAIEESTNEAPNDSRILDFKRRSETRKNMAGTNTDSVTHEKISASDREDESSMKKTLKRKKLLRPAFGKIESATDSIHNSQNLQLPFKNDDKRSCDTEINICMTKQVCSKNNTLCKSLTTRSHQSLDSNVKEHSDPGEQTDVEPPVMLSTSHELKVHKTSDVGTQTDGSQVLSRETGQRNSCGIQTSVREISCKDIDVNNSNMQGSSSEGNKVCANSGTNVGVKKRLVKRKKKIPEPSQPCAQ